MALNRKGFKKSIAFSCIFALLLLVIGCSSSGASEDQNDASDDYYNLAIGTASATGTYYPIGAAMSELIPRYDSNLFVTAQVSGGSIENIKTVSNGDIDIGIANQMHFKLAERGEEPFERQIDNCRTLIVLHGKEYVMKHALQFAVKADSDIYSVKDFVGRKVSVGPAGSGCEVYVNMVLKSAGISYNDFNVQYLSYEEQATAMQDGNIEVASYYSAMPTGGVEQLAADNDIRLIELEDELIGKCIEEWGFRKRTIEAGTYSWMDETINGVVADYHVIFVNKDMDEDLAYRLTKICMDNVEELWDSNPAMNYVDITGVVTGYTTPNLHPGAIRYYEEMGIDLLEESYPPELK
jgi:hypothetical protein